MTSEQLIITWFQMDKIVPILVLSFIAYPLFRLFDIFGKKITKFIICDAWELDEILSDKTSDILQNIGEGKVTNIDTIREINKKANQIIDNCTILKNKINKFEGFFHQKEAQEKLKTLNELIVEWKCIKYSTALLDSESKELDSAAVSILAYFQRVHKNYLTANYFFQVMNSRETLENPVVTYNLIEIIRNMLSKVDIDLLKSKIGMQRFPDTTLNLVENL